MKNNLAVIGFLTIWLSIGYVGLSVGHTVDELVSCDPGIPAGLIVGGPVTLLAAVVMSVVVSYPSLRGHCATETDGQ